MKLCSSSYANASKPRKAEPNCANGSPWSILSPMLVAGKGDAPVIVGSARISSICAAVPSFTICTSWLVPSKLSLSFKPSLDFLTDALEGEHHRLGSIIEHIQNLPDWIRVDEK